MVALTSGGVLFALAAISAASFTRDRVRLGGLPAAPQLRIVLGCGRELRPTCSDAICG